MNDLSRPETSRRHCPVIVIGGGQAGLSMSHCLKSRGVDHLVFEKHRIAHEWRESRWDSFCLVTPNWQCQLPGFSYQGNDPHGFMKKDEIVSYIEAYAASFDPPMIENAGVNSMRRSPSGMFELETTLGPFTSDQVIIAIGGYHEPTIPRMAERLPHKITQLHSSQYRNSQSLPEGEVMVVGSGQSGCQIAEDLHLAGRRVHLCTGGAPRTARFYRGRDVVDWLHDMGYYKMPVHEHPMKESVRAKANHYVTGRDGGRDIDLRKFAAEGMRLYGRLTDVRGARLAFAADLAKNLDQADAVAESIKTTIDKFIQSKGVDAPVEPRYTPVWRPGQEPREIDLAHAGITSIVWSIGYRSDYRWIEIPVFDGRGYPSHHRGVTAAQGLYFLGLPWLYTWGSGRFSGVAQDALHLADRIQGHIGTRSSTPGDRALNELALGS
ncbi:MAG: MSMEG_0569 family flavin-dependent oxidoreductase [Betaproteobacteria bacterium]|nr:MSMEG_0569 family flavin-dependent oxidoreductase [Betaproteobacteria bacterium]